MLPKKKSVSETTLKKLYQKILQSKHKEKSKQDQISKMVGQKMALLILDMIRKFSFKFYFSTILYLSKIASNIRGATIVASDSMTNIGVCFVSLSQVIFSFGVAPEYEP